MSCKKCSWVKYTESVLPQYQRQSQHNVLDTNVRGYTIVTVKIHRLIDTSARLKNTEYNLDLMEFTVLNLSNFPIKKKYWVFFPGMFSAGCQTLKSQMASKDTNILTLVKNCFRKPLQKEQFGSSNRFVKTLYFLLRVTMQ